MSPAGVLGAPSAGPPAAVPTRHGFAAAIIVRPEDGDGGCGASIEAARLQFAAATDFTDQTDTLRPLILR